MFAWKDLGELFTMARVGKQNKENKMYEKYEYIWRKQELTDEQCVYIVESSMLESIVCKTDISIIIVGGMDSEECIPDNVVNCAYVVEEDREAFGCAVSKSFFKQECIRKEAEILLEMVRTNKGLDKMTEHLSDWIKRPIVICDNTYRFIVKSKSEEMDTYVAEKDVNPTGITEARLKMLMDTGLLDEVVMQHSVQYYEVEGFTVYHIPLFVNSVNVAVLGIAGTTRIDMDVLPLEYVYELDKIGNVFSLELAKTDLFTLNGKKNLPYMFSYVLEQEPEDFEDIRERMKYFDYNLLPNMYIMTIPYERSKEAGISITADSLKRVFRNSIYLIRQQEIIFLISRKEGEAISDFEQNIWENQLKQYGLHGGLSSVFTSFKGIRTKKLKEARLALNAGLKLHGKQRLYRFDRYQIDAMFAELMENEDLRLFCYPELMRLIEFDEEKQTGLVETLKEYLDNSKKPREVCERLYIHKNTLYKRLMKIEEIMGCDISNPETIMRIQLTFHILKLIKN